MEQLLRMDNDIEVFVYIYQRYRDNDEWADYLNKHKLKTTLTSRITIGRNAYQAMMKTFCILEL